MKALWCFLIVFIAQDALAQKTNDAIQLPIVEAVAYRNIDYKAGKKSIQIDSLVLLNAQTKNLGELLQEHSAITLKQYGINGIFSPSTRGTSADHTAVVFNGFNLQSPTHGQFDLSLLPVFFTDNVAVAAGPASSAYGSGAVGGAIVLESTANRKPGLGAKAFVSGGSFGNKQLGLGVSWSGTKISSDLRVYHHQAENNFTVRHFLVPSYNQYMPLQKEYKQTKARFLQQGIMHQLNFQLSNQQAVSNLFMYNFTDRLVLNSNGRQLDKSWRNITNYNYELGKTTITANLGLQREFLNYSDTLSQISSNSSTVSSWLQVGVRHQLITNHALYVYTQPQYIEAKVDGYGSSKPHQNRHSLWGGWQSTWLKNTLIADLSIRQQWINSRQLPVVPAIGLSYLLHDKITLKATTASVFHAPDFNDLYWLNGGNPNLKDEQGWSREMGVLFHNNKNSIELTAFQSDVRNLIIWLPGNPFWSPVNVRRVKSQGMEANANWVTTVFQQALTSSVSYTFTESKAVESHALNDASIGKQQIYVPKHNLSLRSSLAFRQWIIEINAHLFSKRFTNTENKNWLPGYELINLKLNRSVAFRHYNLRIFASCNNVLNRFYMAMAGYPMPGRNVEIGINLNYHK